MRQQELTEGKRVADLTSEEILELLSRREARAVATKALDTVKEMFILASRTKPALAPGLSAAIGLLALYREALSPTGKLLQVEAGSVAKILLDAERRSRPSALRAGMERKEEILVPAPRVRNLSNHSRKISPERVLADATLLALPPGEFKVGTVLSTIHCSRVTFNNALIKAAQKGKIRRIEVGIYEKLGGASVSV